jgi:uncharacterized protein YciI
MSATDCYLIVCRDAPDAVQKRTSLLNEHLEYCVRVESRYRVAGVVLTEDQASVAGSAMIVQARDSADALTIVTDDPYYPAGVWTKVDVMPYLIAFGNLVPPRMDRSLRVPGYEDHVESPSR